MLKVNLKSTNFQILQSNKNRTRPFILQAKSERFITCLINHNKLTSFNTYINLTTAVLRQKQHPGIAASKERKTITLSKAAWMPSGQPNMQDQTTSKLFPSVKWNWQNRIKVEYWVQSSGFKLKQKSINLLSLKKFS